ncbi:hypothetical protein ACHAXR_003941 [Thalassiosira sp. AJA248-18]
MSDDWFKPPLTVDSCCAFCECDDEDIDFDEETYEHLSSRRRQELDSLRSVAILRFLSRFTLTLRKENMMKQLRDTDSRNLAEEGTSDGEIANEDVEYTHVLVPIIDVKELEACCENEKKGTVIRHKLFSRKSKEKEEKEGSEEDREATDDEEDLNTEKRAAPIFCAVCLMEFSITERICWASNSACTHVFHEDCILQWLIYLGRKRSKRHTFPRNPSDKKLLDYDLACPCCRQDFISKNLIFAPEEEESVWGRLWYGGCMIELRSLLCQYL